ncbi:MAG: UDP-N-acetylglucosamine 1-carboxyvinyltransferase [Oscillospiraceae bacterium]|nr:UDP-N-acetylglucosamine 1-carboxyvinyltransferase [Oscillospiraceae bacterium]
MEKYVIHGGTPLHGNVDISGAKNAAVAIIPAALMVRGVCRLENLPQISDVDTQLRILTYMGAKVKMINPSTMELDCTNVQIDHLPEEMWELTRRIRASYYLIGAMLGRFGEAYSTMPGGCNFGVRPIDQHIKGLTALGAEVDVSGGFINARAKTGRLKGTTIYLDKVSVGATVNIMIAAATAEGRTVIENVAREPHIVDLANFLNSIGADVRGAGTDVIKIRGVKQLHGGTYTLIPDQIEAGTYMAAVAACGGSVRVSNVIPKHLECISSKLREMNVQVEEGDDFVVVSRESALRHTNVKTMPYPGFPTDMQPQICAVLCCAPGISVVTEGVWDSRYKYVAELKKMGAQIQVEDQAAFIQGVSHLTGATVKACDLRAGAAVVVAGLAAQGVTKIEDIFYIERGYENLVGKLQALGADIQCIDEPESTGTRGPVRWAVI